MRSTRISYSSRLLVAIAAMGLVFVSGAASAQVSSGKATRVGDVPPAGSNGDSIVSLTARFAGADVDLSTLSLTLTSILAESGPGGAGELVEGTAGADLVPLTLAPRAGSRASSAIYVTPGSERPSVRATVRQRADGTYQLNLKVNRSTMPVGPALCSADDPSITTLTTALSFTDGVNPPVLAQSFDTKWICASGRLRVAPPGPAPTPVPGTPTAKVSVEQITRETGEPNVVELDGSLSSDSDGTIASYTFGVVDQDTGVTVFGPATGVAATVQTTLPPGDYRASLTVVDNDGKASKPATRGFRLH